MAAQGSWDAAFGDGLYRLGFLAFGCGEDAHDGLDLRRGGHLVERHAHAPFGGIVEVDALFERQRLHDGCLGLDFERVEELLRREAVVHRLQRAGDGCGGQVGGFRRAAQPFGTVVDAVEARHRGHQGRGGADVRRGALALDVLFAHLQSHAQRLVAQPVDRDADDAARHVALERLARGHVTRGGTAEAHRRAEALRRTHGDVGAPLARGFQERQRQQVGGDRYERALGVRRSREVRVVAHPAVGGRVLHDGAELPAREFVFVVFVDDQFDAERLAAREQHVERLREDVAVDEELIPTFPDGIPRT